MRAWFSFAVISLVLVFSGCVSSGVQRRDMKRVVQVSAVAPVEGENQGRGITVSAIFYDYFYKSMIFNVTIANESEEPLEVDPSQFTVVVEKALSSSIEGGSSAALGPDERYKMIYKPMRGIVLQNPYAESKIEKTVDFLDSIIGEEDEEWEEQMEKKEEKKFRKKILYYEWEKANKDRDEKFDAMVADMESRILKKSKLQKGESVKGLVIFKISPDAEKFRLVFPIEGKEWSGRFWQVRMF